MRRIAATAVVAASLVGVTPRAEACGGYFPPTPPAGETISKATDHRIAVAIANTLVTVWDQVEYAGDPAEFAWVMPIRGRVAVGAGNDDFFQELDDKTALTVQAPVRYCPRPSGCGSTGCASSADEAAGTNTDTGIVVLDRSVVGPYEQVQIRGADHLVIVNWLRTNKFDVPAALEPIFKKYFDEGHDFLAVRLRSGGGGIRAMRPIRVSWKRTASDPVRIPLRMAAAGIASDVGIKLTIVAEKRWRPENYPTYAIDPLSLTWDFDKASSDYVSVRAKGALPFKGRAFAMESSIDLASAFLGKVGPSSGVDAGKYEVGTTDAATDAGDASGADAASDGASIDAGEPPDVSPTDSDVQIAFGTYATRRATRFYGNIPVEYLDQDLVLIADPVENVLDRTIVADKTVGTPVCHGASIAGDASARADEIGWLIGAGMIAMILSRRANR